MITVSPFLRFYPLDPTSARHTVVGSPIKQLKGSVVLLRLMPLIETDLLLFCCQSLLAMKGGSQRSFLKLVRILCVRSPPSSQSLM